MSSRSNQHARNEKEGKMSLLERLAEPAFAKDHVIRPSARILGFLIAAVSALYCLAVVANLSYLFPLPSDDAITPLQIVMGALLPQLLAAIGGIWMLTGDVRGKRLVLVAIAIGFLYANAEVMQVAGAFTDNWIVVLIAIALNAAVAAFVYYLVVTSQVGADPRKWRRILSAGVLFAVCAAAIGAVWLAGALTPYDVTYALGQPGAQPLPS